MTGDYLNLHEQLQEVKEHHSNWVGDFQEYYEENGDFDEFQIPHRRLKERAQNFVEYGIKFRKEHPHDELYDLYALEFEMLFSAFAAELLLNAVMLREDWESFRQRADFEDRRSPQLSDNRDWLMDNLPDWFVNEERKRIYLVLELLSEHRNNTVHMGYEGRNHLYYRKEVYRVLAFLFDHYFDENDLVERLVAVIASDVHRNAGEPDYEPVDFRLV